MCGDREPISEITLDLKGLVLPCSISWRILRHHAQPSRYRVRASSQGARLCPRSRSASCRKRVLAELGSTEIRRVSETSRKRSEKQTQWPQRQTQWPQKQTGGCKGKHSGRIPKRFRDTSQTSLDWTQYTRTGNLSETDCKTQNKRTVSVHTNSMTTSNGDCISTTASDCSDRTSTTMCNYMAFSTPPWQE